MCQDSSWVFAPKWSELRTDDGHTFYSSLTFSLSLSRSRSHTHTHTRSLTHTRTHKHLLPFSFSLHFFFEKTIGRETEACRTNNSRYEGQESLFSRQCRLGCNLVIVIHHTISKKYDSIRIVWTKNSVQLFNVLSCDVREHLLWYMTVLLKMIRPYRNLIIWFRLVLLLMTLSIIEIPNLNLLSKEEKKCCLKSYQHEWLNPKNEGLMSHTYQ